MAQEQNDKRLWGVTDFERYHSGKMPEQEMYALEKASLEDPFLEDALEGYIFTTTPVADIEEIKNKLAAQKEQAKIIWYKQKLPLQVLKIAAVVILFAGLGWLLYPAKENKQKDIAAIKIKVQYFDSIIRVTDADTANTIATTLPGGEQKDFVALQKKSDNNRPGNTTINDDYKNEIAVAPATAVVEEDMTVSKDIVNREFKNTTTDKTKVDQALNSKAAGVNVLAAKIIKGKVVDKEGQPVPFASITVAANDTNIATDANGNFAVENNQNKENIKVDVNAVGFKTTSTAINAMSEDNNIVLHQNNNELSEVVVAGNKQQRQKRSVNSSAKTSQPTELNNNSRLVLKNAQPLTGLQNFNLTVIEVFKKSKKIDTTGEVILLFDINNAGAAVNISLQKSLNDSGNAKAIDILKNIPAIKKIKKGKKAQAIIRF